MKINVFYVIKEAYEIKETKFKHALKPSFVKILTMNDKITAAKTIHYRNH